jgi:hypothetical protein
MEVFLLTAYVPVGLDRSKVFRDYRFTEEECFLVFSELADELKMTEEDIPFTIEPSIIPTDPLELLKFINLLLGETVN